MSREERVRALCDREIAASRELLAIPEIAENAGARRVLIAKMSAYQHILDELARP